jgi:hypothetical protein
MFWKKIQKSMRLCKIQFHLTCNLCAYNFEHFPKKNRPKSNFVLAISFGQRLLAYSIKNPKGQFLHLCGG